jgi:DNA-binding transcriptional MerR regulator
MSTNTYATAAFAMQIGVSKTSVNHYVSMLEENGYKVSRNARKHRVFTEKDIKIVKALIALNKQRGIKLKDAAQLVTAPDFKVSAVVNELEVVKPQIIERQYDEIAQSMELLATHVYGIEQQNTQLLELIHAQRKQNELLMEQNNTLKHELNSMMNHLLEKANEPAEQTARQLNRVEQQNNAIMNGLNSIRVLQRDQEIEEHEQKTDSEKGLLSRLFNK